MNTPIRLGDELTKAMGHPYEKTRDERWYEINGFDVLFLRIGPGEWVCDEIRGGDFRIWGWDLPRNEDGPLKEYFN
jgi:hypothetical protein